MKTKIRHFVRKVHQNLILVPLLLSVQSLYSCSSPAKASESEEKHMAQTKGGNGMIIYADRVDSKAVLRMVDTGTGKTAFSCYRIGMIDSTFPQQEKKQRLEWGKYFDYEMQKNWTALDNGDSIPVVFFQRLPQKSDFAQEAVLVFEVSKGISPDTLVYRSTYQLKNTNVLVLEKKL